MKIFKENLVIENLKVSVDQPVGLKIIIIFSKRVDQLLRNLQKIYIYIFKSSSRLSARIKTMQTPREPHNDLEPPCVKEELQECECGHIEVQVMTRVALTRVQELTADQTHQEETVHCQSHHLRDNRSIRSVLKSSFYI